MQRMTDLKKTQLAAVKAKLQEIKYQASEQQQREEQQQAEEQARRRRAMPEQEREEVDPEKLREELGAKTKKMKEVVASAIMSIARVAH